MDCIVHAVAKSCTQLSDFHFSDFWEAKEPFFFIFPCMLFGIPLSPHTFFFLPEKQCHSSVIQPWFYDKRACVKRAHYTILNIPS